MGRKYFVQTASAESCAEVPSQSTIFCIYAREHFISLVPLSRYTHTLSRSLALSLSANPTPFWNIFDNGEMRSCSKYYDYQRIDKSLNKINVFLKIVVRRQLANYF
jgi:hypothetical protein